MKYWPMSIVKSSPLMPPVFAWELFRVYETCYLSAPAFQACGDVAQQTQPASMPNLAVVESIGAPARQLYTNYPDWEEWSRLERGGVFEASNGVLHVIIDALH